MSSSGGTAVRRTLRRWPTSSGSSARRACPRTLTRVEIEDDEQARRERFPGSPTIRIDGRDIVPPGEGEPYSLTCRVYRTRDGRVSPVPDPEDLRDAVRRAA